MAASVLSGSARLVHLRLAEPEIPPTTSMELTFILSLFGAVALTLVVPAIRGMYHR
jgi:hypothetical protein